MKYRVRGTFDIMVEVVVEADSDEEAENKVNNQIGSELGALGYDGSLSVYTTSLID